MQPAVTSSQSSRPACVGAALRSSSPAREQAEQLEPRAKPWLRFWKVNPVNKGTGSKDVPVTMDRGTEAGQEQKHTSTGEGQSTGGGTNVLWTVIVNRVIALVTSP